jgi:hypothetical protein
MIRIRTVAKKVEQRSEVLRTTKDGDNIKQEIGDPRWFITIGNVAFDLGNVEPDFKTGDEITITIEKR